MTTETTDLHISDFDFDLPEAHIAKRPPEHREDARLLDVVTQQGTQPGKTEFHDRTIKELPTLVQPGDIWVINDTKVIPARLFGQKITGGQIEILLLEPAGEDHQWFAWGKSNKPLKAGTQIHFSEHFSAEVLSREGKTLRLKLIADDVGQAIESHGHMPLPPYIDRPDSEADQQRYQTVFAEHKGAVAAPTAGLHLTPALMQSMEQAGARFVRVTLHVGPGTFQPVQVDHVRDHQMHEEAYIISEAAAVTINQAKAAGQRRRHHQSAYTRSRQSGRKHPRRSRKNRYLYLSGLPVSNGRRPADQLPPAPLHPADARLRTGRQRASHAGLSARYRTKLSILFLR